MNIRHIHWRDLGLAVMSILVMALVATIIIEFTHRRLLVRFSPTTPATELLKRDVVC